MKIKKLVIEDLKNASPKAKKIDLDKLDEENKEKYINLYNLYRKLFTEYLIEKLDLKLYDNLLLNSGDGFNPVPEEKMDIYQYFSMEELKYFYVRNNIYVEKLDEEEKNFFESKLESKNLELDLETEKMIEKTFPKVILEDLKKGYEKYKVFFGPDNKSFLANNDSIVIGFRYDNFKNDGLGDDAWFERFLKQRQLLNSTFNEMNEKFKKEISNEVTIIKYSDVSVIPR